MPRHLPARVLVIATIGLLAACGSVRYTPVAGETTPVDLDRYAPAVDSFVVLLDTSGSMTDDGAEGMKIHTAQDLVASFNDAVPELGFNAGMVIFGKGAGTCMGNGVARKIYGMTTYDRDEFLAALSSIECARSTTPIVDALDLTSGMLADDEGQIAVIVFSDFKWDDTENVASAVSELRSRHGDRLCLHGVRIGDYDGSGDLVESIMDTGGCDSMTDAADVGAPQAMTDYAAQILMAPVAYETHTLSAMALFALDSATITRQGSEELERLAGYIRGHGIKVADIDIVGHACDLGTEAHNQDLSERRAGAVRDFLVGAGVNPDIITASGMGEMDPLVPNTSENNRRQNRRVEVHVGTSQRAGS